MKWSIIQATALCATLGVLDAVRPPHSVTNQKHISATSTTSELDNNLSVPGHNNATYGPVPRSEQLFNIQFLEIAPTPWEVYEITIIPLFNACQPTYLLFRDKYFFTFLRGYILDSEVADVENIDKLLATATAKITLRVILPNGKELPSKEYTIPLRTIAFQPFAHVAIRDATGKHMDHLNTGSMNDIITDYMIPALFVERGTWKFGVLAELEDGRCLFAIELKQWLEGRKEL